MQTALRFALRHAEANSFAPFAKTFATSALNMDAVDSLRLHRACVLASTFAGQLAGNRFKFHTWH